MERSASVFQYYGNKFIHEKMEKIKKKEEKLKKNRNKINQLSQKDIIDNNIVCIKYFHTTLNKQN